jgi:hypothetical protein
MSDEDFVSLIRNAVRWHGERGLASLLRVSTPTIRRWADGRNLAHPALRDSVAKASAISTHNHFSGSK